MYIIIVIMLNIKVILIKINFMDMVSYKHLYLSILDIFKMVWDMDKDKNIL